MPVVSGDWFATMLTLNNRNATVIECRQTKHGREPYGIFREDDGDVRFLNRIFLLIRRFITDHKSHLADHGLQHQPMAADPRITFHKLQGSGWGCDCILRNTRLNLDALPREIPGAKVLPGQRCTWIRRGCTNPEIMHPQVAPGDFLARSQNHNTIRTISTTC